MTSPGRPGPDDRMNTEIILLAVLMFAVTIRPALGLLTPGFERLPAIATDYLQLVGPAILAALAAVASWSS